MRQKLITFTIPKRFLTKTHDSFSEQFVIRPVRSFMRLNPHQLSQAVTLCFDTNPNKWSKLTRGVHFDRLRLRIIMRSSTFILLE